MGLRKKSKTKTGHYLRHLLHAKYLQGNSTTQWVSKQAPVSNSMKSSFNSKKQLASMLKFVDTYTMIQGTFNLLDEENDCFEKV